MNLTNHRYCYSASEGRKEGTNMAANVLSEKQRY